MIVKIPAAPYALAHTVDGECVAQAVACGFFACFAEERRTSEDMIED
jgi:hypothetical protein